MSYNTADGTLKIYTAGAIQGLNVGEAKSWRQTVTDYYRGKPVQILNPMSNLTKADLAQVTDKEDRITGALDGQFKRDLEMVQNANLLLVRHCKGFGTPFEMGYAFAAGTPIIGWDVPKDFTHPFLDCYRAYTFALNDALFLIDNMYVRSYQQRLQGIPELSGY